MNSLQKYFTLIFSLMTISAIIMIGLFTAGIGLFFLPFFNFKKITQPQSPPQPKQQTPQESTIDVEFKRID